MQRLSSFTACTSASAMEPPDWPVDPGAVIISSNISPPTMKLMASDRGSRRYPHDRNCLRLSASNIDDTIHDKTK